MVSLPVEYALKEKYPSSFQESKVSQFVLSSSLILHGFKLIRGISYEKYTFSKNKWLKASIFLDIQLSLDLPGLDLTSPSI